MQLRSQLNIGSKPKRVLRNVMVFPLATSLTNYIDGLYKGPDLHRPNVDTVASKPRPAAENTRSKCGKLPRRVTDGTRHLPQTETRLLLMHAEMRESHARATDDGPGESSSRTDHRDDAGTPWSSPGTSFRFV